MKKALWPLLGLLAGMPCSGPAFAKSFPADCAALVKDWPGAPCSFDFSKFRDSDPWLGAVREGGRGLFSGRSYTAHNAQEANRLSGKLQPGDQLLLAAGDWRDAAIRLAADGNSSQPILIRAEQGAQFTGGASISVSGSNLIVQDFAFTKGAVTRDNFVALRLGDGAARPCNRCMADHVSIDDYNSAPSGFDNIKIFYLVLEGQDITVANSSFRNKKNYGTMISADLPAVSSACPQDFRGAGNCYQRLLFTGNTVSDFGAARPDPDGNHKLIQLGWSGVSTRSAYSVIADNVFERATGENETISLKASDVIVRGNIFRANQGTLNLRSANRVLVEDNVFDGAGAGSMGGVRIEGAGHWILNNDFRRLVKPRDYYYWPVAIHTATDEDLKDSAEDYARAKNIVIAGNRFDQDQMPAIAMGIYPDASRGRTLAPDNIFLLGNVFRNPIAITPGGSGAVYYPKGAAPAAIVERGETLP